ncbi:MAG: hypothetical protein IPK82_16630 [Polyangiaceae bacterium]|nr:hypothetical protein [Polyangiaceae bacterium]
MEAAPTYRGPAKLFRRNRLLVALPFLLAIVGALLVAYSSSFSETGVLIFAVPGVMGLFVAPFLLAYTWIANPARVLKDTHVVAGSTGVAIAGRRFLKRKSIKAGFTLPTEGGVTVQLERRFFKPVELLLPSMEDARALLKSLGLDVSQSAINVKLRSLASVDGRRFIPGVSILAMLLGPVLAFNITQSPTAAAAVALTSLGILIFGLFMLAVRTRATVAADGIFVSHLWDRFFIPYSQIERVLPTFSGFKTVALILKSGKTVHLPALRRWTTGQEEAEARRLASRIETAMVDHQTRQGEGDNAALERRHRSTEQWLTYLRGVGSGANADHRQAPIPADRLWRIVESSSATAEARAAAAVALGARNDSDTRARLTHIAGNIAAPKLRILLEKAATSSESADQAAEEEMLAALDGITSQPKSASK